MLDTNAFSDLMRENPRLRARLAAMPATDRAVICSTVRGEILFGIRHLPAGKRRRELESKATNLFAAIPCEPVPEAAGDHYAAVKISRQQQGLTLDENDLWIAATVLAIGAVLVTRDSDFQRVSGLIVEDWTT